MSEELTILACAPEYPSVDRKDDGSEVLAALSRSRGDFDRYCGPLEFNGAEVRSISSLSVAEVLDPTTDLKREFTSRAAHAGVIHLAMHGFNSEQDPALSGLVFDTRRDQYPPWDTSDTTGIRDGTLRSYEIKGLDLDAELVVLSACQTAAGTYMNGEGTMSLTTSFMEAGARNVISSLWKVDDRATKEIMVKFYEHLAEGMGKADALAEAKRWYRKENPNAPPSHWAAFILIGDNEPVRLKKRSPVRPWMWGGGIAAVLAAMAARRRRQRAKAA